MKLEIGDGARLLQGILDDPDDLTLRLVYADWLEEDGRAERAEFIRCQVAAAATGQVDCERKRPAGPGPANNLPIRCGVCAFCRPHRRSCELHRDHSLLLLPSPLECAHSCEHWSLHVLPQEYHAAHLFLCLWRGFVEFIAGPLAALLGHGPAIVRRHPVTRTVVTDRAPERRSFGATVRFGWTWTTDYAFELPVYSSYPWCLPKGVWRRAADASDGDCEWDRRDEALEALYAAVLEHCREKAKEGS